MLASWPLPPELTLHIFSYLEWKDKLSFRCCKHFNHLFNDEQFWNLHSKKTISLYEVYLKQQCQIAAIFFKLIYKKQHDTKILEEIEKTFSSLKTAEKSKELLIALTGGLPKFLKIPAGEEKEGFCRGVDDQSRLFISCVWTFDGKNYQAILKHCPKKNDPSFIQYKEKENGQIKFTIAILQKGVLTPFFLNSRLQEKIALNFSN